MRMWRNGDEIPALLPRHELIAKMTALASEDDPVELADTAFWAEGHALERACHDGMEALMSLARFEQIGWEINAGYRCDFAFDRFVASVCDNSGQGREVRRNIGFPDIQAATPQGALAAGILAILQAREAARTETAEAAS